MRAWLRVLAAALLFTPGAAVAELLLPPGFTATVYVTGDEFDVNMNRDVRGIPSVSTLAFDESGALYLARTGRRYTGGEVEDIWPLYRIPAGGAQLTPKTASTFIYGPPLPNPQVGAVRGGRELFVTTFDRERRIGVLYRIVDGRIDMVAGGTPARGTPPLLKQPEGVAVDARGDLYVADRDQGTVVRLDRAGQVLDARYVTLTRPRVLAFDGDGRLWIGSDAKAEAPWQPGSGELWQVSPEGVPRLLLSGPVAQAISLSPGGNLFVADRQHAEVFAVTPDGIKVQFARFTEGDTARSLVFAPLTAATRKVGVGGDLFVVTIRRGTWQINEVVRISGPFDELVRQRLPRSP